MLFTSDVYFPVVLQAKHTTIFSPPLPEEKIQAIQRLGMGIVDKIFVTFHFQGQNVPVPKGTVLSYQLLWKVTVNMTSYLSVRGGLGSGLIVNACDDLQQSIKHYFC